MANNRWKGAENRVAEELNKWFVSYGLTPIRRKFTTGRTGPDYTFNELKLVIDEKSRLCVPNGYTVPTSELTRFHGHPPLLGIQLKKLDDLLDMGITPRRHEFGSSTVFAWYHHMKEWQVNNLPDGLVCLVLHRPGMHFDKASLIISEDDRMVLYERISSR